MDRHDMYDNDAFDIIALDPNVDYETSDDDTDMECEEDTVACSTNENNVAHVAEMEPECQEMVVEEIKYVDKIETCTQTIDLVTTEENKPRKKLNLEEYKIRRANKPAPTIENKNNKLELCENIPETLPIIILPTDPRSIKNLMSGQQQQLVEEITVEEDFTEHQEIHPDYEEIVLVSIECNTDISISPKEVDGDCEKKANLLTNIVNSFQQSNHNNNNILTSSTTLLSSINAVLSEKRSNIPDNVKVTSQAIEHGENKVIMHLRKDRIRPFRNNCQVQTDLTHLFPPLILSPSLIFNRIKNARNFRRKTSRSRSRSRSRSISPESEFYNRRSYKYSRSVNSSSMNSSDSSCDSDTSAYSSCRSSDSLKQYNNNDRYKQGYQRPNYTYQEERKIIYIGGLFEETTKDELRRKFLKYGTIKKISLHVKNEGTLRYGFVTFAEANAAYDVLDRFSNDPALCNFDLRFGGRRKFCRQTYADLDSCKNNQEEKIYSNSNKTTTTKSKPTELSFEDLLSMTKRKLCSK